MLQLWFGDEEFPPNLRILWDENALLYLRYETMYFAVDALLRRGHSYRNIREGLNILSMDSEEFPEE